MKKIFGACAIILTGALLTGCGSSEQKLECSKELNVVSGVNMTQVNDVTFKKDKIQKFNMNFDIKLDESMASSGETYYNSLKSTYESQYGKYDGITVTGEKKSDTEFKITITFDYPNISDADKTSMGISGSESYSVNKQSFQDQGYTCK